MATETPKQPSQNSGDDWANSVPDEQPSSWNPGQDGGNYQQNSRPMGRGYRGGHDRGMDNRDNRQYGGSSRGSDQDKGFDNSRDNRQYGGNSRGFDQNRRYNDRQDNRQPWRNNRNFDQDGGRNWDNSRSDRGGSRGFPATNNYRGNQSGWGRSRGYDQEYAKGPHKNQEGRWSNDRDYNGRGSYERQSYNYNQKMDDTSISRALSNILRHSAEKVGLELDRNGYVFVEDLLKLKRFGGVTVDDLRRVVSENDKQRFKIETDESTQKVKIRANQGHSQKFQQLELDLTPVDDPIKYPIVIHGTYYSSWEIIRKEGLKTMKRVHIHFAPGLPGEDGVISGMRTSCEVLIYIDLEKALKDGLKFSLSSNNVILSSGDKDGLIAPKYFLKAVDRKIGNVLRLDESIPIKKKLPVGMTVEDQPKGKGANKKQKKNKKDKNQEKYSTEMEDITHNQDAKDSANEKKSKKHQNDTEENSPAEVKTATEEAEEPAEQVAEKAEEVTEEAEEKGKGPEKAEEEVTGGAEGEETKKSKGKGAEKTKEKGAEKPKEKDAEKPKESSFKNTFEKTKNAVKKLTDESAGEEKVSSSKENESSKKTSKTKTAPPNVHLIKSAEDEKLDELKNADVLAVHALKKKDEIAYVLVSRPGAVFVFDPIAMKEFLKPLLENEKCQKVMFDHSLNDEISKQLKIVMYEKPVPDIQVLFSMKNKRKLAIFSEIIGEECSKLSQPTEVKIIDEITENTSEKSKQVKKILTQVAQLVPLYDSYRPILDSEDDTSPDKYKLDDYTMAKINQIFGGIKTVVGGGVKG